MASPKPYAFMSKESSDVQVLVSDDPLVTVSASVPSSSSARVMDSIEPLVPTAPVQLLDSIDPLTLPCVSSVLAEPVADHSGLAGPSGVATGSSGSLPAIANSAEDEDEDIAPPMPRPTGSSSRTIRLHSNQIKSMWNWRKIFSKLGTHNQCIEFAEERGLILKHKMCSRHHSPMTITKVSGQLGKFRCRKSNCRTKQVSRANGTWFENARLSLTLIFQIIYAFSEGLTYHQTRKELVCDDGSVVSTRTVADWFTYCRATIALYKLENQRAQGKIGGPNKVVQIDKSKFGKRKNNCGKHIEAQWVIGMIEDGSDDLRLEVCPNNETSADVLVPLIKKHVEEGSIIHTGDNWKEYSSLSQHGYIHKTVNHSDPTNKFMATDRTHTKHIESQWKDLRKRFQQQKNKQNFADWLCEYSWRRRIMVNHLDPYEELLNAILHVYKLNEI